MVRFLGISLMLAIGAAASPLSPGARVVVDAHNCYPYDGRWADRISRALAAGAPLAIEQDLATYRDPSTGARVPVLSHNAKGTAADPTFQQYFFESVRPVVEAALHGNNRAGWPLITLNLDLKTADPRDLAAIWSVLDEYRDWLTTAPRVADTSMQPLDIRPILVLNGSALAQQIAFRDRVPVGARLLTFGALPGNSNAPADNYHRWVNRSWAAVETGGPFWARSWTLAKQQRLDAMVQSAHDRGLWIRFYSLDGESSAERRENGWHWDYNFGSLAAVEHRWRAAAQAGVDYIATDQYETLASVLHASHVEMAAAPR